jgi:hypothetical protein
LSIFAIIKRNKNIHSADIFGMKFAIEYLQSATTFLEYGFKFFDYNILHDGPVFNILQRAFKTTEDY